MTDRPKKENYRRMLGSQGHGEGVTKLSNGSNIDEEDMFTDEQTSKEDILHHKAKEQPLLMDAWGVSGEHVLVGNGKPTNEYCGNFYGFKGCDRVDLHNKSTLDGQNFKNKAFVRRTFNWCNKPSCPICFKHGWAVREAGNIEARLEEASKKHGQIEHVVVSVPPTHCGLPYKTVRKEVSDVLLRRGIAGGVLIFHAFRYQKFRGWYYSPHFHILGFVLGGYSRCRNCKNKVCIRTSGGDNFDKCDGYDARQRKFFKQDGFITKVLGKRKTVFGTAWYQLNHASYRKKEGKAKRHVVATWFGVCSYRKMKFTPEKRVELCPICNHELKRLKFLGGEGCIVKHRDDPDFTLDSYEDYYDSSGQPLWVEAPKRRRKLGSQNTNFFGGLTAKEWVAQGLTQEEAVSRAYADYEKIFSKWDEPEEESVEEFDIFPEDAYSGFEKWRREHRGTE